jgi:hypothetical protein
MTAQVVATISNASHAEYWAERIGRAHAASVEAIVNTGRELLAAKAKLPHGEWGRLTGQTTRQPMLPFGWRSAQTLMAIASHPALSNAQHVAHLPPSWGTLAVLSQLPADVVERQIADEVIHPELDRKTAEQLVLEHKQAAQPKSEPLWPSDKTSPTIAEPPALSSAREAELDAQLGQALSEAERESRQSEEIREAARGVTAPQGAWSEVFGRLSAIGDLAAELHASLKNRLQPLPPPDTETATRLVRRLGHATHEVGDLFHYVVDVYLKESLNDVDH